jgi:tRNA pseudouridine13 synthase
LLGNSFKIRIKALKHSEATVEVRLSKTMEKLESIGGIPNFFGHQRFGTARPITHIVGKAILNGDFEEAAMRFLAEPSEHEHVSSRQARAELQEKRDFGAALQNYPKQLRFERLMLRHLVERKGDFVGAFRRLPIKLQQLFVQAYQSYLFNRFLSERIRNGFPLNSAEVGNFVVNVERSGLPMTKTGRIVNADCLAEVNGLIKAGKLRVALPLVGTRQRLSEGAMGEIEKRILESEGMEPKNFNVNAIPEISGKGQLRSIVSPVRDFRVESVSPSANGLRQHQAELGFTLLRGSYATMLLREIMKPPDPICAGF